MNNMSGAWGVPGHKDGFTLQFNDDFCVAIWYGYGLKGGVTDRAPIQTQRWWICTGNRRDGAWFLTVRETTDGTWRCFYKPQEVNVGIIKLTIIDDENIRVKYDTDMGEGVYYLSRVI